MEKEIIWSNSALIQLEYIYHYLLKKTKSNSIASKVVEGIYDSVTILKNDNEIYELDEMKISNNGSYRAYEIYNYRISYRIMSNSVNILRVRHTSRYPKKLK